MSKYDGTRLGRRTVLPSAVNADGTPVTRNKQVPELTCSQEKALFSAAGRTVLPTTHVNAPMPPVMPPRVADRRPRRPPLPGSYTDRITRPLRNEHLRVASSKLDQALQAESPGLVRLLIQEAIGSIRDSEAD
jgi:hypothetical protein